MTKQADKRWGDVHEPRRRHGQGQQPSDALTTGTRYFEDPTYGAFLICWPSRFSWNAASSPTPGRLSTAFAVMPFTCSDSSIQLRPASGNWTARRISSCSTWKGSRWTYTSTRPDSSELYAIQRPSGEN